MARRSTPLPIEELRAQLGDHLQEHVPLSSYTTARVGGIADAMIAVGSGEELERVVTTLWKLKVPFFILGSGANVLVSDQGYHGVVIINRAHQIIVDVDSEPPTIWAESGAIFATVARRAALRGLSGMEWAATIPAHWAGQFTACRVHLAEDIKPSLVMQNLASCYMDGS